MEAGKIKISASVVTHLDIDSVSSADSFPKVSHNNNVQFKFSTVEYCLLELISSHA